MLEPGLIAPGQTARLVARPNPEWSLDRIWNVPYRVPLNRTELEVPRGGGVPGEVGQTGGSAPRQRTDREL